MKESTLEKKCCRLAKEAGWLSWKWSSPSNRGVPDRIFMKQNKIVFVEFKAPGKKPTKLQKHFSNLISSYGFKAVVVDNTEAFKRALNI